MTDEQYKEFLNWLRRKIKAHNRLATAYNRQNRELEAQLEKIQAASFTEVLEYLKD